MKKWWSCSRYKIERVVLLFYLCFCTKIAIPLGTGNTPLSQCPGGTFSLSGDENFYRNPNGDRKSIVFSSKIPVGMVLECNFFHSISNGDKIIGQFPSGVEILGYFSTGANLLANFSNEAVCDTAVLYFLHIF